MGGIMENSAELNTLHEKVMRYLKEMKISFEVSKEFYRVKHKSTAVIVHPIQWRENATFLRVLAVVLSNVQKKGNEAMFEEFSDINNGKIFGKIYWMPDKDDKNNGNIYYEHCLLGETLDFDEFENALVSMALIADDLDDKLQSKYGGKRFVD